MTDSEALEAMLVQREAVHGEFKRVATLSQSLRQQMHYGKQWESLSFSQREALGQIAIKIARILSGDPKHADHWADIAGYATLIVHELEK